MQYFTFGLPLGSSIVFLGLFTLRIILTSFEDYLVLDDLDTKGFAANKSALLAVIAPGILPVYFWIFVIIRGSRISLVIWTGCYVVLVCIFGIYHLRSLSGNNDPSFWINIWTLFVYNAFDCYVVGVAVQGIICFWTKKLPVRQKQLMLFPIGQDFKHIFNYYLNNPELLVRILLMLDIVSSLIALSVEIPTLIHRRILKSSYPEFEQIQTPTWNLIEDVYLRVLRIVISLVALRKIVNLAQPSTLRLVRNCHLFQTALSCVVYYFLCVKFSEFSLKREFERANFLLDMAFRLAIAWAFVMHIESIESQESDA